MTNLYIVLLATAEATIPFAFVSVKGENVPRALQQAALEWRASSEGQQAESAYLAWWNAPPMFRPIDSMGWEAALVLMSDDVLAAHGLKRVVVDHSTVEPGESVELSLVDDPPRPVQVATSRIVSAR